MVDTTLNDLVVRYQEATVSDVSFLMELENLCFESYRRSSYSMIRTSLKSTSQTVLIIYDDFNKPCGSITFRIYKKQSRITSLAVLPTHRGKNFGKILVDLAIQRAVLDGIYHVTLEVDANDKKLITWYESIGFEQSKVLENYYYSLKHAIKMKLSLNRTCRNVIVTDTKTEFFREIDNVECIEPSDYIDNDQYRNAKDIRIFNMCFSYKYQSVGYYVSLLALARNHVAYPSASLIKDTNNQKVLRSVSEEISDIINMTFSQCSGEVIVDSFFGKAADNKYQKLVSVLSNLYHSPLVRFIFKNKNGWHLAKIKLLNLEELQLGSSFEKENIKSYFSNERFVKSSMKQYEYYMAILVDPDEKLPPSDKEALKKFEEAAHNNGFYVDYITKKDYSRIPEYDALFIRTTTNVNDYTYEFAKFAYAEGLVVMDDPWSILRCANKIYLHEALQKAKIKTPKTWVFNKRGNHKRLAETLEYPVVLKLPDSAFSAGVFKVENVDECSEKLKLLFKHSDLILAQEFTLTDFDWRIGVLDGVAIYACKYFMAKNHWQIVDWDESGIKYQEGDYEAIAVSDVPKMIINSAIKAANVIGDGLYGVDLKQIGEKSVVIEVNDNPSIEYQVEDIIEGNNLYDKIMSSFYNRLENNNKMLRTIS